MAILVRLREAAGLTQRQLAKKLKRPYSMVARMEMGERRVDIVELYWIAAACGSSLEKVAADLSRKLKTLDLKPPRHR